MLKCFSHYEFTLQINLNQFKYRCQKQAFKMCMSETKMANKVFSDSSFVNLYVWCKKFSESKKSSKYMENLDWHVEMLSKDD